MITKKQIDELEHVEGALAALHAEIGELSKRKPSDGLNLFKLDIVNEVISRGNKLLGAGYKPVESFAQFDPDSAPSNSDVAFILAQYAEAVERFRSNNVHNVHGVWRYICDETIRTRPPKRLERD